MTGQPCSLHVPTFDEDITIENGQALTVDIEVRDKAGNVTMHPKLNVNCKVRIQKSLTIIEVKVPFIMSHQF